MWHPFLRQNLLFEMISWSSYFHPLFIDENLS
jgi:hypothetical protein